MRHPTARIAACALVAGLGLALTACDAGGTKASAAVQPVTLSIGTDEFPGNPLSDQIEDLAAEVHRLSGGAMVLIQLEDHGAGQVQAGGHVHGGHRRAQVHALDFAHDVDAAEYVALDRLDVGEHDLKAVVFRALLGGAVQILVQLGVLLLGTRADLGAHLAIEILEVALNVHKAVTA